VRFVDREQRNVRAFEQVETARGRETFGREVENVELAGQQRLLGGARLPGVQRRVEERRTHAQLHQRRDLVLHQRDQG
jgi:hypothetical protein